MIPTLTENASTFDGGDRHPDAARLVLVGAHRAQRQPDLAPQRGEGEPQRHREQDHEDVIERLLEGGGRERCDRQREALCAAGDAAQVERQRLHHEQERDRHDREDVGPGTHRDGRDRPAR